MQSIQVGKPYEECEFEVTPYLANVTGEMRTEVWEVGGTAPTGIIRTDQAWYVLVKFVLRGQLVNHLCGEFCICLHFECIGAGLEESYCKYIEMDPCKDPGDWYEVRIDVPAGTVPGIVPPEPGPGPEIPGTTRGAACGQVCCLTVTLTSIIPRCEDEPRRQGHIAAFCRGPCVMFTLPTEED